MNTPRLRRPRLAAINVRTLSLPSSIGAAFLLLQLGSILIHPLRRMPSRYWCWAPNDHLIDYVLRVDIAGRSLTAAEIERRYHVPAAGRFENVPQHFIDIVQQYERTYGRHDRASVVLTYRLNGRQDGEWRWGGR